MARWQSLRFDFEAMACPCVVLLEGDDQRVRLEDACAAAIAEVRRIEAKYSRYRVDSVVAAINRGAGRAAVAVDAETEGLLDYAQALHALSGGCFDITSGALRRAWDFRQPRVPAAEVLAQALACVGWQRVERGPGWVRLPDAGMEIDFGGFGKEYAADRAAMVLQAQGVVHALVNLGGDLMALGPRGLPALAGEPWCVDIQHPRPSVGEPGQAIASLRLSRGGLATSGDYERYFVLEGRRYCHLVDARTGWPVGDWQSVTVLGPSCSAAGALATIAMLKGATALHWLRTQQARYLAVRSDGTVWRESAEQTSPATVPA